MVRKSFKFSNGDHVVDKITGFAGIVRSRADYLTGCNRYAVQNPDLEKGKPADWRWFDEDELLKVEDKKPVTLTEKPVKKRGGPLPDNQYAPL